MLIAWKFPNHGLFEKKQQSPGECWLADLWALASAPCSRYEEEINKRTTAENDFVVLKKVRSEGWEGGASWGPWPWARSWFSPAQRHLHPTCCRPRQWVATSTWREENVIGKSLSCLLVARPSPSPLVLCSLLDVAKNAFKGLSSPCIWVLL